MQENHIQTYLPPSVSHPITYEESSRPLTLIETLLQEGSLIRDVQDTDLVDHGKTMLSELISEVLSGTIIINENVENQILQLIHQIDAILTRQVNEILHHPKFQKLEGSWRGLETLVTEAETGPLLKINVLDAKKEEYYRNFQTSVDPETSAYFKKIYRDEYDTFGGNPYGCVIGDFYFDVSNQMDCQLLGWLSRCSACALTPFFTGTLPKSFGWESFRQHTDVRDLRKIIEQKELIKFRKLRETDDAKFIGLTLPRYLGRSPYNQETYECEHFNFVEDVEDNSDDKFTWTNAAYLVGMNITRAWALHNWPAAIRGVEGGGLIEDLPVHLYQTDDGDTSVKIPTEVLISDRREKELSDLGFISVCYKKDSDVAAIFSMPSIYKGKNWNLASANSSEYLSTQFPYLLSVCKLGHYLKIMLREKIGSFLEVEEAEELINRWMSYYVLTGIGHSQEQKAARPFKELKVKLIDDKNRPGCYKAELNALPHFQLDEIKIGMRLVSEIPSKS